MKNLYRELGVRNILLVGADHWTRDSLSLFFQIQGCRLLSAENEKEAGGALAGNRFDLILCEHRLPDVDGLSFLQRSREEQPGAVRILIAGYPTHAVVDAAARCGIHDVIRKPFATDSLGDSLRRCMRQARGSAAEPVGVE